MDNSVHLKTTNIMKNEKKLKLYRNINYGTIGVATISTYGTVSLLTNDNIVLAGIAAGITVGSLVTNYIVKNKLNKIMYYDDNGCDYKKEEKDNELVLKK